MITMDLSQVKTTKGIIGVFTQKNLHDIISTYPNGCSARQILEDHFGGYNELVKRRISSPIRELRKKGKVQARESVGVFDDCIRTFYTYSIVKEVFP